jgi:AraC-like DNA-binding protein
MHILISEKSGILNIVPDESYDSENITGIRFWCDYSAGNSIKIRELARPSYCAELMTFRLNQDDKLAFSERKMPYTLIFVFGSSVTLYLAHDAKMEMHDRASNLFYSLGNAHTIQFRRERDYILILIHYTKNFVSSNLEESAQDIRQNWEYQSPVFYYSKSKIVTWSMMEFLSMLLLPSKAVWNEDFISTEIARAILLDFLHEENTVFQPGGLRSEDLITFYQQRDRVVKVATTSSSISKILLKAEIRNIPLFRKRLNQLYDLNVRDFILETKMARAMTLLKDPTLSIKEIAFQAGFSNSLYFSRVFTQFFGSPPKTYHSKNE